MTTLSSNLEWQRCFGGVARLYTDEGSRNLEKSAVTVVGVGGVGSWASEALVRTAIGKIYLIDLDNVALSNTNRQIQAMQGQYGKPKIQALAERFALINPRCEVIQIEEMIDEDNVDSLLPPNTLVLDCIDQVRAKAAIVACCVRRKQTVITSGAAGGRRDPFRIQYGDLGRISGDPLLSKVRYRLRKEYGFPKAGTSKKGEKFGVLSVFSDEPVVRSQSVCEVQTMEGLSCAGYGSTVAVTAPMGMMVASLALNTLAKTCESHKKL